MRYTKFKRNPMHKLDPFHTTTSTPKERELFEKFFETLDKDFQNQTIDMLKHGDVSFDLLIENYLKKDMAAKNNNSEVLDEILEDQDSMIEELP